MAAARDTSSRLMLLLLSRKTKEGPNAADPNLASGGSDDGPAPRNGRAARRTHAAHAHGEAKAAGAKAGEAKTAEAKAPEPRPEKPRPLEPWPLKPVAVEAGKLAKRMKLSTHALKPLLCQRVHRQRTKVV